MKNKEKNDERIVITVPEAARLLGINRCLAYDLARRGEIPALRLGRRIVIPRDRLERLLSEGKIGGPR